MSRLPKGGVCEVDEAGMQVEYRWQQVGADRVSEKKRQSKSDEATSSGLREHTRRS